MSSINYEDTKCLCGKDKLSSNINDVNWLRHIKSYDVRKRRHKNSDISTFFTKFTKKTCKDTNVIIELDNNSKNNVASTSSVNIMTIIPMTSENSVMFAEEIGPNLNTVSTTDNNSNTGTSLNQNFAGPATYDLHAI
uniref:Uncharacterized protein n=1 Tax=Schizaphis graminum TaxID=13262 RepID=A0A2S2NYP3_SCHGA